VTEGEAEADRGRLADLYLLHAREATRLAYLLTGDHSQAEDIAHDAFVRVAGRLVHLRRPDAFVGYLRRAVVNLARMHFRRMRVERAYLRTRARAAPPRDPPEAALAARDSLRRALMELPYRQRAAIVLRFYLDLPDAETADVLRCAEGTVRSLISRGMDGLRQQLRGDADGG
jgi:RNA polymerase sigma factor (sigma-70 family)